MKHVVWLSVMLLFFTSIAQADELPSLGEVISRALAHSPDVAMAQARVSHAQANIRSARQGWFHPELRVFAGESAITGTARAGIQVSHDLMRLLTLNRDEVREAEHDRTLAQYELTRVIAQVSRQAADAWSQLHMCEQTLAFKQQTVAHQATIVTLTKTQFDESAVSLEQLIHTQEALAHANEELVRTQADEAHAHLALAQLLGEPLLVDGAAP